MDFDKNTIWPNGRAATLGRTCAFLMPAAGQVPLISTSETGIGEHGAHDAATESCTRRENVDSLIVENMLGPRPSDVAWSHRARFYTAPSRLFRTASSYLCTRSSPNEIRIWGLVALGSTIAYEVCHEVSGFKSALTITACVLCFACLVLFSASMWRAMARNVLRMLIIRPRCVLISECCHL